MFPSVPAVERTPQSPIIASKNNAGIAGINPHIVEVSVPSVHRAEALAAIRTEQKRKIDFEDLVLVLGIDYQVGEIKRTPHHVPAGVEFRPVSSTIIGAEQRALLALDHGVNGFRLGRRYGNRDTPIRFLRHAL